MVGLLHRNEVWHAWLFRATDFCWQAVESLEKSHPYEIEAAVAFLDAAPDRPRAEAAADRLGRLVREQRLVVLDPDASDAYPVAPGYAPGEHHFPHDYARTPDSLARAWFTDEEMARSLDHLADEQQEDGGWPVRWRQWAPGTALEARPMVTIEALRTLRALRPPSLTGATVRSHGRPAASLPRARTPARSPTTAAADTSRNGRAGPARRRPRRAPRPWRRARARARRRRSAGR